MSKCLFCELVANPSQRGQTVFEDGTLLVILDDFPKSIGHTLVILKEHQPDVTSILPEAAAAMGQQVTRVAAAIKNALGAKFIYVASIGEQVQHVHYHLIPRYEKDGKGFIHFMSSRGKLSNEPDKGLELVQKIRAKL